ncbi:hypothetical protein GA0115253_104728 [Streptomyces sp. Termitarium-T10T-6]|nr:hypothetical protein GA0115253_104728 [Streptomyces sp. Termitarium-T10T-6]
MVAVGARRDQDVAGLHVPVHQVVVMGGVERGRDLGGDPDGGRQIQRPAAVDEDAQIRARDEPHGDVEQPLRLARLEHRHDVGVVDRGRHP